MISKNFARCLAKISGDGYLYYRYIRYANKCDILREEFKCDIRKEFGEIKIYEAIGNSGTPFVQIHGNKVIQRFLEYLKDYRSSVIFVPKCIKESELLRDVKDILAYWFGIISNKIIKNNANNSKDKSYVLSITGKDNIIRFKENIGFKHPEKIRKLNLMIESYNATSKNVEEFEKIKCGALDPII